MQTYIHNGVEVKLTGRRAVKKPSTPSNIAKQLERFTTLPPSPKDSFLVEVTPVNEIEGMRLSWVSMDDLWVVEIEEDNTENE